MNRILSVLVGVIIILIMPISFPGRINPIYAMYACIAGLLWLTVSLANHPAFDIYKRDNPDGFEPVYSGPLAEILNRVRGQENVKFYFSGKVITGKLIPNPGYQMLIIQLTDGSFRHIARNELNSVDTPADFYRKDPANEERIEAMSSSGEDPKPKSGGGVKPLEGHSLQDY